MTQISDTDSALVRMLNDCDFPGVDVASGPHEWDGAYVQKLLAAAPAIRVVFAGAEPHGDTANSTELNMDGRWMAYIVVGWNGRGEEARRIGAGAGHDLLHRAASVIHSAILTDGVGDRLPIPAVYGIDILADAALDRVQLWVAAITVVVELPLPLLDTENCYGPLDDFLRVGSTIDLPDTGEPAPPADQIGEAGDLPGRFDLPQ